MRERLDCAVLLTRCTHDWVAPAMGCHAGGRLQVHGFETEVDLGSENAWTVLASESMALRRFDVCILPVTPATLSWARISLAQAAGRLHTPVIAYVKDLTAAALYDLYQLGVAEFLRDPFCAHEARIRVERLLDDARRVPQQVTGGNLADGGAAPARYPVTSPPDSVVEDIRDHGGYELEAYAIAAASRSATARESFRDAKSHVVARFERAYIRAALGRHGGNIAMAARAAKKHRRAFWALMRKHDIDATPFRELVASAGADAGGRPTTRGTSRPSDAGCLRPAADVSTDGGLEQPPVRPGLIHYARTGVVLRHEAGETQPAGARRDTGG